MENFNKKADIGCPATADVLSKEENKVYALEDLLPLPLEVNPILQGAFNYLYVNQILYFDSKHSIKFILKMC